jgi:hypothetical protein
MSVMKQTGRAMTFEQLMREHDLIDTLTRRLEKCCRSEIPDPNAAIEARSALKDALDDHLGHEDEAIYPPLIFAGGQPAEAVAHFEATFAQLRTDWSAYLEDWDAECISADWDSFRFETAALMARVRERTHAETSLIYPLALQKGVIALRGR